MSFELPVLRLGCSGFTADQQARLTGVVTRASSASIVWQVSAFAQADAWWVNGARTQMLADGTLRIAAGTPTGRSTQLSLPDIDRPVAFAHPLPRNFEPAHSFDQGSVSSMTAVLGHFERWLRPLAAQFCLASQIMEHEAALASGVYEVMSGDRMIATVDLQGEAGVLPTATPADFESAMWVAKPGTRIHIPEHFCRASLSQLMWQYATRTSRDLLPRRYRSGLLYFRRPPRLSQRLLHDSHLLLVRELVAAPASFEELAQRTGMTADTLAHELAALYLVGAITSNAKRAAETGRLPMRDGQEHHSLPSNLNGDAAGGPGRPQFSDLTAPAPMSME